MKVNIEVDCTPDEARRFLGLPDVAQMQQTVVAAMEQRLVDTIKATDSQTLLDQWLPLGMKGMEQWQAMWTQVAQAAAGLPRAPPETQGITHRLLADTIYAPAAGAGRSALGVIRISGPAAGMVATVLGGALPEPRVATLRRLRDPRDRAEVDQAVLLWFPAPRSATGEDVLEIQHHGGPAILAWLLEILTLVPGCRPAVPGEFARRAFLAGKLDLTAAEGLADLVDAQTRAQARQALRQLDGKLGRLYGSWRARLLDSLARIEAEIDFGSEGEEVPPADLAIELADLATEMVLHLGDARGERLRSGIQIAVTGAPNVGKSSLVNLLAGREVALVSEHPGTTRDVIEASLEIAGVPVTLLDTAGLRETADPVEVMGVERARARAATADLELRLFPAGTPPPPATAAAILVASKRDRAPDAPMPEAIVAISTVAAPGISALLDRLAAHVAPLAGLAGEPLITRARHRAAVGEACTALDSFRQLPDREVALRAEELRRAAQAIGRVTGAVGVEDILNEIFARFCLGK